MNFPLTPSIRRFLRQHPIISIGVPLIVGLGVQAAFKSSSDWIEVFVPAARVLLSGRDIYGTGSAYWYPPFMALTITPFAALPELAARLAYFAVNVGCIIGLVRSGWVLSGGSALPPATAGTWPDWAVFGIGITCGAPYILNALAHQQVDVIIAFLTVAGCLLLVRRQSVYGAVLIGLAAACKGPPLLFVAYLMLRRQWLPALVIVFVAVGANLLPDIIIAPPDGHPRLLSWVQHFVVPTFTGQIGAWNGVGPGNQSIAGTMERVFATRLDWSSPGLGLAHDVQRVPEVAIKLSAYGLMLGLLAASVVAGLRGQILARPGPRPLPSHTALELSTVSLLVLLLSPMTDLAHLGPTVLPALCLARIAVVQRDRMLLATVILAAAGALAVNKDLVGETAYTLFVWAGIATWSMLALWVGCVMALAAGRGAAPVDGFTDAIIPYWDTPRPIPRLSED